MELSAHILRGRERTKPALCAGNLVVGFAEEFAGFQIETLSSLVDDFALLAAAEGILCSAVVD